MTHGFTDFTPDTFQQI